MAGTLASRRYAKAFLDLSIDKSLLEESYADMQLVEHTVSENRDLANLLNSPIVKSDKKQVILQQIFKDKVNAMSVEFMNLIIAKGRAGDLRNIATSFVDAYLDHKGISEVEVTSAVSLSKEQKDKIMKLIADQGLSNVELVEKVDLSLIGGFVIKFNDKQIDASVANQFNELKQNLINN